MDQHLQRSLLGLAVLTCTILMLLGCIGSIHIDMICLVSVLLQSRLHYSHYGSLSVWKFNQGSFLKV